MRSPDPARNPDPARHEEAGTWLTVAVVDDSGRLLDVCDISDDPDGYALLGTILTERSNGPTGVAIAADSDDHLVTMLLAAAGRPLAFADDDSADDFAERFADDESVEEMESPPAERRAVGLARALQAGALSAVALPAPREMAAYKPVLAAHAAVAVGRQAAAVALREVLRELYPAALRAYPDPAETVPLAVLDALPEPGLVGGSAAGRGRDAAAAADAIAVQLAATGVGGAGTIAEAITALRVAIAETPRRGAVSRSLTNAVANTIRQAVAAVRACDAANAALIGALADRANRPSAATRPRVVRQRPVPVPPTSAPPAALRAVTAEHGTVRVPLPRRTHPGAAPISPAAATVSQPSAPISHSPVAVPQPPAPVSQPVAAAAQVPPAQAPAAQFASAQSPPAGPSAPGQLPPGGHAYPAPAVAQVSTPVVQAYPPPAAAPGYAPPPYPYPVAPHQPVAPQQPATPQPPAYGQPTAYAQPPAATPRPAPYPPYAPVSPAVDTATPPPPPGMTPPPPPGMTPIAPSSGAGASDPFRTSVTTTPSNGAGYTATDYTVPVSRPAPQAAPPGSRARWPLAGQADDREPAMDLSPDPILGDPYPGTGATSRQPAGIDRPSRAEGRVTPPWQADDLPPEPPMLRLVEPPPLADPALRRYEDLAVGNDGVRFDPPNLRLVESEGAERGGRRGSSKRSSGVPSYPQPGSTALDTPDLASVARAGSDSDADLLIFAAASAWFTGQDADADIEWRSSADVGWRAAEQAARPAVGAETAAGLPKRVPQANLVPGSPVGGPDDRQLRIVRDPESIAAHTSGYFRGWRRGQEIGGYAVGGRPGRESAQGWDFSREPDLQDDYPYGAAAYHSR